MKTVVEWLAEKYDYAYWMVKRDEILPALAEEWKKHYLEQAKEMEKDQICKFASDYVETQCSASFEGSVSVDITIEEYYNLTFKSE